MAQINKPSDYFNTKLYSGTGSSQAITGVGFESDFTWIKQRSSTQEHWLVDSVRGTTKFLESNSSNAESSDGATGFTSFDSDGFTVNTSARTNASSNTYASWNWYTGATASSNTDGDITSSVSHNSTSGFSIGTYTGTGTAGDTVGHGLNANPDVLIVKERGNVNSWVFSHKGLTDQSGYYLLLNSTDGQATDNWFNNTSPTTSVFSTNSTPTNRSGGTYVFYAFTEKKGYSKFGSYAGNGNANGTFVYTGFKPAFLMCKAINTTGENWRIFDNKRSTSGSNVIDKVLRPNTSGVEFSSNIDFVSNGVKIRNTDGEVNTNGYNYIYMAFAEQPLVGTNNIPATAR